MAYFVTFLTPDGARSCVMQCTLPTQGIRSIISMVFIHPEGFLPSIVLLVVIIVAVVIVVVTVILVVVVVTIVRVVIVVVIIRVVVVGDVSFIITFSFVIIGVSLGSVFLLGLSVFAIFTACASRAEAIPSGISCRMAARVMAGVSDEKMPSYPQWKESTDLVVTEFNSTEKFINEIGELRAISDHVLRAAGVQIPQDNFDNLRSIKEEEDRATEVQLLQEEWESKRNFLVAVNLVKGHTFSTKVKVLLVGFHLYPTELDTLPVGGDVVDLTGDEDPTDEDRDTGVGVLTGVSMSLGGEIFSGEKKSQESNIGGSDNTGDRGKTADRAIIAWGGGIASYDCMIYGSLW
nr:hypothetical protein [Tanacetum cinerariifolium]